MGLSRGISVSPRAAERGTALARRSVRVGPAGLTIEDHPKLAAKAGHNF